MNLLSLIEKTESKQTFENIIYTVVHDSIMYRNVPHLESKDATREMLEESEEFQEPKTEEEILDSLHDNANDALVITAEPMFEFIHELCLLYYDELKEQKIEAENDSDLEDE